MSKENATEDVDTKLVQDGVSVDWFLQNLSNLTNSSGLEFGITLNVSGQTISGTMIGGKKYFEVFADSFADAWPHDDKDEIRDAFAKNSQIYSSKEGDEKLPPTQYVHLMDAKVFNGNSTTPSNEGVLWRGKINAISGFSLGKLS